MRQKNSFWQRLLPVVLLLLAMPFTADAHNLLPGVGPVINGVLHPFTITTHVLMLLSLGLFVGQRPPLNLKLPLTVFIPFSALALAATSTGMITVYPPLLIGSVLITGLLIALDRPLPALAYRLIFAWTALLLGLDSKVESVSTPDIIKTLLGTWIALIVAVTDVAFYISYFIKKQWQRVGIRVAGSWIAAASLMILAFIFRR